MMLRNVFGDAVEDTGTGQHAKHGDQLAEITRLPNA
jgi:hypothetical protein